ncbi:MAG: glycoside hydrolase family 3 C-terminal domain-containing protein [Candidatus Coatesbacteria bacterium]
MIRGRTALACLLGLAGASAAGAPTEAPPAWRDSTAPWSARVNDLVGRMTLREKFTQLGTNAPAIPRLGVPAYAWGNECLHGVVAKGATSFPQPLALAAAWDPDLVRRIASAIGDEARILHRDGAVGLTFFSPVVNMARDPRWGRVQETYGEDPLLTARLAVAYVKGLQGDDSRYLKAAATAKHYAANNEEWRRNFGSADVDEYSLREYYLPQFRACVREGGAAAVMCAYNAINGVPCCANKKLLTRILREEWGFTGYVVADCGAVADIYANHRYATTLEGAAAAALHAGCDLDCHWVYQQALPVALARGLIVRADVDRALRRLFAVRFRLGEFDPPERDPWAALPREALNGPAHRELAREAAAASIVLLRNQGGLLPLSRTLTSLAVIGPMADRAMLGNYSGEPPHAVTPLEGLRAAWPGAAVRHAAGCDVLADRPIPGGFLTPPGAVDGRRGVRAEYFANPSLRGVPLLDRVEPALEVTWTRTPPAPGLPAQGFSVRWTARLTPPATGRYTFAVPSGQILRVRFDGRIVVDRWRDLGRESAGQPSAALFALPPVAGDGRLRFSLTLEGGRPVDVRVDHVALAGEPPTWLGWDQEGRAGFAEAVEAARASEAAIVCVGTDERIETEGRDRDALNLPGVQEDLVRAVVEANPRTVVVLVSGGPVAVPPGLAPALLEAWYCGEAAGFAIADVLSGVANPSGRLPVTAYASATDLPPFDSYDVRKGRTYRWATKAPLYPFGFGLSYTTFVYRDLTVEPAGGGVRVRVAVANSGGRAGAEVVQVYRLDPGKALVDFRRITLAAGAVADVEFTLTLSGRGPVRLQVGPDSSTGLTASVPVPPR